MKHNLSVFLYSKFFCITHLVDICTPLPGTSWSQDRDLVGMFLYWPQDGTSVGPDICRESPETNQSNNSSMRMVNQSNHSSN